MLMFCSSQAKRGLIVYCNLNPDAPEYNPYNLLVVDRSRVDPRHYYTFTDNGVTQMMGGHAQVRSGCRRCHVQLRGWACGRGPLL